MQWGCKTPETSTKRRKRGQRWQLTKVIPPDYPIGRFASTMNKAQHASLNRLLNSAVESSRHSSTPLHFSRARHVDSFYSSSGGKTRVSRDLAGNVVENGVVRKQRIADLNIFSPRGVFDWRISASVEEPAEMPSGAPASSREKDRACYRHQLCQVDLTVVTAKVCIAEPGVLSSSTAEKPFEAVS